MKISPVGIIILILVSCGGDSIPDEACGDILLEVEAATYAVEEVLDDPNATIDEMRVVQKRTEEILAEAKRLNCDEEE